ncbi:hypothetical protein FRC01_001170 [Tulasnella sp. 417]|nr:hypothetical protein FRC01_001170 [Tulasnella sp. 417]
MDVTAITSYITTNNNWGTMDFKLQTLTAAVSSVNFIAHANPENQGEDEQPPTNHWTMLLTTGNEMPVHIDVIPAEEGSPGMVVIEHQELHAIDNAYVVSVCVKNETTVADILRLIAQKGRDRYIFADIGEGCRYWMYTFAGDLEDEGILNSPERTLSVKEALQNYWPVPAGTPPVQREMAKGRFF